MGRQPGGVVPERADGEQDEDHEGDAAQKPEGGAEPPVEGAELAMLVEIAPEGVDDKPSENADGQDQGDKRHDPGKKRVADDAGDKKVGKHGSETESEYEGENPEGQEKDGAHEPARKTEEGREDDHDENGDVEAVHRAQSSRRWRTISGAVPERAVARSIMVSTSARVRYGPIQTR
jgi:hypothetical protein